MSQFRPTLSSTQKISGNRTRYEPLVMSDESVYNMAAHNYTQEEIADAFKITRNALMDLHGDAFNAGKNEAKMMPRVQLARVFKAAAMLEDNDILHKDVAFERVLKAIELHFRKYEGLGQKQEVQHTFTPVDPSQVKFNDLTPENVEQPWVSEND